MTVLDTLRSYSTPLTLVLVIFGPQILNRCLSYIARRNNPTPRQITTPPLSRRLKVFLALHTSYHLSHLLIPPFDLFSTPHIPILAPNDILRSRLLRDGGSNALTELLLSRLQNLDNRLIYLRFGHGVQDCIWCLTPLDYLVASLPDILSRYVLAAGVIMALGSGGLVGSGAERRSERWGGVGLWVLGLMCIGELGVKYLWDLRISAGDTLHVSLLHRSSNANVQLSHNIHLIRTAVLLLLPLLHSFLPPAPPTINPSILLNALQNSQNTQRLTSLARESIAQNDYLRQLSAVSGRNQAQLSQAIRTDKEVKQAIEDYRLGDSSNAQARHWIEEGWNGLMRIQMERQIT